MGFRNLVFCTLLSLAICTVLVYGKKSDEESEDKAETAQKNSSSYNTLTSRSQNQPPPTPAVLKCKDKHIADISTCPSGLSCSTLGGDCLDCDFNCTCIYGRNVTVTCSPKSGISCLGNKNFTHNMVCRYCYQTPKWDHLCSGTADCPSVSSPRKTFKSNCTVNSNVICLGNRSFFKKLPCNWTSGYSWYTALILSITLGGFGADRFYLGHWKEGIGKLLSFGGLGVWTLIDVILISIRYLGPANSSLYLESFMEE